MANRTVLGKVLTQRFSSIAFDDFADGGIVYPGVLGNLRHAVTMFQVGFPNRYIP